MFRFKKTNNTIIKSTNDNISLERKHQPAWTPPKNNLARWLNEIYETTVFRLVVMCRLGVISFTDRVVRQSSDVTTKGLQHITTVVNIITRNYILDDKR